MALLFLWAAFVISLAHVQALYENTPTVTVISTDTFSTVSSSPDMWIIEFHKDDCIACENLVPQFQDLSKRVAKYGVKAGSIDCTTETKLCEELNVGSTPMLKFFSESPQPNPYTKAMYRTPLTYTGLPTAKAIDSFIQSKMHHTVQRVSESSPSFSEMSDMAKKQNLQMAVLFTERTNTAALYKSLSHTFENAIVFAEVHSSLSELIARFNVAKCPTLVLFNPNDESVVVYDGNIRSWDGILAFLSPFAKVSKGSSSEERGKEFDIPMFSEFTKENIEDRVSAGDQAWLVSVDEVEEILEWWMTISKKAQGMVSAARLNCSEPSDLSEGLGAALCTQRPSSVCVFPYGKAKLNIIQDLNFKKLKCYSQSDDGAELALVAAFDSLPDTVSVIDEASMQGYLGAAFAEGKLSLFLLSSKPAPPPIWRNIALVAANYTLTGFLSNPAPNLMKQMSVDKIPSILCMYASPHSSVPRPDGTSDGQVTFVIDRFSGPTSVTGVMQFVYGSFMRSSYIERRNQSPPASTQPTVQRLTGVHEINSSSWDTLCDDSASFLCAISFTRPEDSAKSIAVMEEISQKYDSSSMFVFMYVDGECYQKFADQFDVQPHKLPTIIAYSPKRGRYSTFIGSFNTNNVKLFLDGVGHGRAPTFPMEQRPMLDDACADTGIDVQEIQQDEAVDDMLAEIRREEAMEKQRLAKELEEERLEAERKILEAEAAAKAKKTKKKRKKKKLSTEL